MFLEGLHVTRRDGPSLIALLSSNTSGAGNEYGQKDEGKMVKSLVE